MKKYFAKIIFSILVIQCFFIPMNTLAEPVTIRTQYPFSSIINVGDFKANINKIDVTYELNKDNPQIVFDYYIKNTSNTDKVLKLAQPIKNAFEEILKNVSIKVNDIKIGHSKKVFSYLDFRYESIEDYGFLKLDKYIDSYNKYQDVKGYFNLDKQIYVYELSSSVVGLKKDSFEFNSLKSVIESPSPGKIRFTDNLEENNSNKFVVGENTKYIVECPISKNGKPTLKHKNPNAFVIKKMSIKDFLLEYKIPKEVDNDLPNRDEWLKYAKFRINDIYIESKEENEDDRTMLSRILWNITADIYYSAFITAYAEVTIPPNEEKKVSVRFDATEDFVGYDHTKKDYYCASLECNLEYLKSFDGAKEMSIKVYTNTKNPFTVPNTRGVPGVASSKYPFLVSGNVPFKRSANGEFYYSTFKVANVEDDILSLIFGEKDFDYNKATDFEHEYDENC